MDYTDLSPKQRRSARHVLIGIAAAHSAGFTLVCHWGAFSGAIRWLAVASAASAWIYCRFRSLLPINRHAGEAAVFPDIGAANRITLLRGVLVAQLAGFAALPWSKMTTGPWPWIPGMLYGAAVVLDAADGYIARRTGRVTRMGAQLDMETDALGMLVASVVAVTSDQLPPAYLVAGMAYYLFAAGIRIRHFLRKPVGEVRPWQGARIIAGCQMALLTLALLPFAGPPATTLAAWIVMIPLLAGFGRDWLIVCGFVTNDCFTRTGWGRWAYRWATCRGPIGIRIAAAGFGIWWVTAVGAGRPQDVGLVIGAGLMAVGCMGRTAAVATVWISGGMLAPDRSGDWGICLVFVCALIVMMAGTGPGSLWRPEDRFFFREHNGAGL